MFKIKTKEIIKQIRFFQSLGFKVLIPVKSFSNEKLISDLRQHADGFDISNKAEARLIPKSRKDYAISAFSPITKDVGALTSELKKFSDSVLSLHTVDQVKKLSAKHPFVLRVNPYSKYKKPGTSFSRFGFSWDDLFEINPAVFKHKNFRGFSTQFGLYPYNLEQKLTFLVSLKKFCHEKGIYPEIINLGGGWGSLQKKEIKLISKAAEELFHVSPWCEPGRALFNNAIECSSTITDETKRKDCLYLHIDTSFLAHFRWCMPEIVTTNSYFSIEKTKLYNKEVWFCGSTCCETDRFGPFWVDTKSFNKTWVNKKILLKDLDGYGLGWNHSFNGQKILPIKFTK